MLRVLGLVLVGWLTQAAPATLAVHARAFQPGEVVVADIVTATRADAVHVSAFGRSFHASRLDDRHWQALVGIDLDVKPGPHTLQVDVDEGGRPHRVTRVLTVRAKAFPTRRLTVDEAFVNPPEVAQVRIAAEAQDLERLWPGEAADAFWHGPVVAPVPQPANSAFGTRSVFNGQPRSPHGGADFPSPAGTPVHAPAGGRVRLARDLYYTGHSVVIDHGAGLVSLFAHLSRIDVAEGDVVTTGQAIGLVGATGRVTGPHLHWSLRAGGARVDPVSFLAVMGGGLQK